MPPEPDHEEFLRYFVSAERRLSAYVRTLVMHPGDAEDILQAVAIVLWRRFSDFTPGTNFTAWACRIAYHEVLHYRRKQHRSRLEFNEALLRQIAEEVTPLLSEQDRRENALRSCMEKLPRDEQALIQQRHWQGVTGRSLARLLGRSESSISRTLGRIYARLLDCIRMNLEAAEGGTR